MSKAIVLGLVLVLVAITQGDKCFSDNFDTTCTNTYSGVQVGARCYFLPLQGDRKSWNDAWDYCISQGGKLAHIQTQKEFTDVVAYLKVKFPGAAANGDGNGIRVALRDNLSGSVANGPDLALTTTKWFTDKAVTSDALIVGNTWIQTQKDVQPAINNPINAPRCFVLYDDFRYFLDNDCNKETRVLCQLTNRLQKFKSSAFCINDIFILELPEGTKQECAERCADEVWCHSFNFNKDAGKGCKLFTYVPDDAPNKSAATGTCTNYVTVV